MALELGFQKRMLNSDPQVTASRKRMLQNPNL